MDQKEEINIEPEQNEETRIQKNEERLRNFQDNFKHLNIRIIGVPEGEEEEQEIENLFEQIVKENFPNRELRINPHPHSQLIFHSGSKHIQWAKDSLFNKWWSEN